MRYVPRLSSRPTPADLGLLDVTAVVPGSDRGPADPPPPVAVCEGCGAVADLPAPAGWETAPAADGNAAGRCPACQRIARDRITTSILTR